MRVFMVLLMAVLGGCATPYQDMGFRGGVEAQRMTADTYRIVARGNAYTAGTAIQDYTLLKAAEATKAAGATHFAVISASDASRTGAIATPGQIQTSAVGNGGFYRLGRPSPAVGIGTCEQVSWRHLHARHHLALRLQRSVAKTAQERPRPSRHAATKLPHTVGMGDRLPPTWAKLFPHCGAQLSHTVGHRRACGTIRTCRGAAELLSRLKWNIETK